MKYGSTGYGWEIEVAEKAVNPCPQTAALLAANNEVKRMAVILADPERVASMLEEGHVVHYCKGPTLYVGQPLPPSPEVLGCGVKNDEGVIVSTYLNMADCSECLRDLIRKTASRNATLRAGLESFTDSDFYVKEWKIVNGIKTGTIFNIVELKNKAAKFIEEA